MPVALVFASTAETAQTLRRDLEGPAGLQVIAVDTPVDALFLLAEQAVDLLVTQEAAPGQADPVLLAAHKAWPDLPILRLGGTGALVGAPGSPRELRLPWPTPADALLNAAARLLQTKTLRPASIPAGELLSRWLPRTPVIAAAWLRGEQVHAAGAWQPDGPSAEVLAAARAVRPGALLTRFTAAGPEGRPGLLCAALLEGEQGVLACFFEPGVGFTRAREETRRLAELLAQGELPEGVQPAPPTAPEADAAGGALISAPPEERELATQAVPVEPAAHFAPEPAGAPPEAPFGTPAAGEVALPAEPAAQEAHAGQATETASGWAPAAAAATAPPVLPELTVAEDPAGPDFAAAGAPGEAEELPEPAHFAAHERPPAVDPTASTAWVQESTGAPAQEVIRQDLLETDTLAAPVAVGVEIFEAEEEPEELETRFERPAATGSELAQPMRLPASEIELPGLATTMLLADRFDPLSTDVYNLAYTCLLIPRLPSHYLAGDLAQQLGQWLPQICLSYGWRLEGLSVRPQYLQWICRISPNTAPALLLKSVREQTSQRVFQRFPHLAAENFSRDFWAPGYLILSGVQTASAELLRAFIHQTRIRQGVHSVNRP